jgi:hypothetical protein
MFDEQNQNPNAPKNLPSEPVDMFAGMEKNNGEAGAAPISSPDALAAGLLKKKEGVTVPPNLPPVSDGLKMSAPILGKALASLVAVLLLGSLAYGGWWFLYGNKNKPPKSPPAPANQAGQNQMPQDSGASANIPAQINNEQILFGQPIDSDKDGLDDAREKEIGTNPQNIDTDGDGLSDGDEVVLYKTNPLNADADADGLSDGDETLIWRTNPLNSDTDGDSYPDGTEVRNGYSPLGPGKLFSSPTTTNTTSFATST